MCALLASSGTTPPNFSCTFWLAIILDKILPSLQIAAAVSSQDDSMAKIVIPPPFSCISPGTFFGELFEAFSISQK
jgi:hypothetical protein